MAFASRLTRSSEVTFYASVIGVDGSDLTDSENSLYMKPSFGDFGSSHLA